LPFDKLVGELTREPIGKFPLGDANLRADRRTSEFYISLPELNVCSLKLRFFIVLLGDIIDSTLNPTPECKSLASKCLAVNYTCFSILVVGKKVNKYLNLCI
jgi:hypothetical protein